MRKHPLEIRRRHEYPDPSECLASAILESGSFAVVAIDLSRRIVRWNRAAEQLYGWRASEAIGRAIELIVPDDRRDEFGALLSALQRGEQPAPLDTTRVTKTGATVQVHMWMSPVLDGTGNLCGASLLTFDNSEQVATRAALLASESRYRALVDTLSEFVLVTDELGEVAHAQPSWSAYTGQDFTASAGRSWLDAVHVSDRNDCVSTWVAGVASNEAFAISARLQHESGAFRYCEGRVTPLCDPLGRVVEWVVAFSDVHDRRLAQEREHKVANEWRRIYAANIFGICSGNRTRMVDANGAMLELLGISEDDLDGGVQLDELVVPAEPLVSSTPFGDGEAREFVIRRSDGSTAYILAAGVGTERGWLAVAADVTERKEAEQAAEHRALHDALTGLPNRRLLVNRLEHALMRSKRSDATVGILFCDLDNFKEVNDTFGHAAGDEVLKTIARRLAGLLREVDTFARTGGDEFVILVEDLADPDDAACVAERVRPVLSAPIDVDDRQVRMTASFGVALSSGEDDRVERLLGRADDAMYRAKKNGRDQVVVSAFSAPSRSDRRWVERELKRALADDALTLAFQPVIDLRAGRAVGAEALLRWHVEGELVPTAHAIAVAEESGIIIRISDWVLREACRQFGEWRAGEPEARDWRLHINVSARDIADEQFVERVLKGIAEGGCVPSDLCLEVTETAMLQHPERCHERLRELQQAGVVVAIDDFGMGYASLGVLRDVPADIVKIDRSFVAELNSSERDRAIVEHAIDLSHRLGLIVVGEGVESLAQMTILEEYGCDRAQGYAFAPPGAVDDLLSWPAR